VVVVETGVLVGLGVVEVGATVVEPIVEELEGPGEALPALGPAMEVVMGACSMKIPDQNQSSAAALVPPLGRRRTPMCQSAEFVEVLADLLGMTCLRSSDPVDVHRPTVLAEKSMS